MRSSITKTGNPRCRHWLIELAWRALAFQPDYWVVKKFKPRIQQTKGRSVVRKKLIVAIGALDRSGSMAPLYQPNHHGQIGFGRSQGKGLHIESILK